MLTTSSLIGVLAATATLVSAQETTNLTTNQVTNQATNQVPTANFNTETGFGEKNYGNKNEAPYTLVYAEWNDYLNRPNATGSVALFNVGDISKPFSAASRTTSSTGGFSSQSFGSGSSSSGSSSSSAAASAASSGSSSSGGFTGSTFSRLRARQFTSGGSGTDNRDSSGTFSSTSSSTSGTSNSQASGSSSASSPGPSASGSGTFSASSSQQSSNPNTFSTSSTTTNPATGWSWTLSLADNVPVPVDNLNKVGTGVRINLQGPADVTAKADDSWSLCVMSWNLTGQAPDVLAPDGGSAGNAFDAMRKDSTCASAFTAECVAELQNLAAQSGCQRCPEVSGLSAACAAKLPQSNGCFLQPYTAAAIRNWKDGTLQNALSYGGQPHAIDDDSQGYRQTGLLSWPMMLVWGSASSTEGAQAQLSCVSATTAQPGSQRPEDIQATDSGAGRLAGMSSSLLVASALLVTYFVTL